MSFSEIGTGIVGSEKRVAGSKTETPDAEDTERALPPVGANSTSTRPSRVLLAPARKVNKKTAYSSREGDEAYGWMLAKEVAAVQLDSGDRVDLAS